MSKSLYLNNQPTTFNKSAMAIWGRVKEVVGGSIGSHKGDVSRGAQSPCLAKQRI